MHQSPTIASFEPHWTCERRVHGFATATGTQAEPIPAADAQYLITAQPRPRPGSFTRYP